MENISVAAEYLDKLDELEDILVALEGLTEIEEKPNDILSITTSEI